MRRFKPQKERNPEMQTEIYELTPRNGRKSFYGKAKIIREGNRSYLMSYETIIGCYDAEDCSYHRYSSHDSHTTRTHVLSAFPYIGKDFWKLPLEKAPNLTISIR